jgi:Tfp pilus assembly protein FimT
MKQQRSLKSRFHRGFTSTELVVASSLLVALMGVVGPLAVRNSRLWIESRHHQLALEELTGELERLTAMDSTARAKAIESLKPSGLLLNAAPDATIEAETLWDQDGERLVLTLRWNRGDHPRAPLRLVAWLDPLATEANP